MSIQKRPDRERRYRVRWREGGRQRNRTFDRKTDAEAFELEVRRRKQLGPLAATVMQSHMTLAEFVSQEWWPRDVLPDLAPDTRRRYEEVWTHDLMPRLGNRQVCEIAPKQVEDLREKLIKQGLSVASQRKALLLLSGILERAVVHELIAVNPVSKIRMPKGPPASAVSPLVPDTVERIRQIMLAPRTRTVPASGAGKRAQRGYSSPVGSPLERQRNALIVSMLAYGGLRPAEDRSASWGDLRERTLHVYATKTRRSRELDLLGPLAQDLAAWRLACGRPADERLIIPRPSGGQWTRSDWANWRARVWRPAAIEAGVSGDLRPYRLRHSFVSLLLWSGEDLAYVADQAGHSIATLAKHYAGVMAELRGQPRVPAAEAIRQARAEASGQLQIAGIRR